MVRAHPLWRGFWLAAAMAAGLVLLGAADDLSLFRLDRPMVALGGGIALGAFLGALPGRLRRSRPHHQATSWQRCLRAFLCGFGMLLALRIAGDGRVLPALMTGSAGAWGFCLAAMLTGFITLRIAERRSA